MEFVVEFIFICLFNYPGGVIRWLIKGAKKGELKRYLEDWYTNVVVFSVFICFATSIVLRFTSW